MSNIVNINNGAMPVVNTPLIFGTREGFKTEEEARSAWEKIPSRLEWALQAIVHPDSYETIAFTFVPCDPQKYKTYYKVSSID